VATIVLLQISKTMMRKPVTEEGQLQSFDNSKHSYAFDSTHIPNRAHTSLPQVSDV
jgi:hypothetical protein